MWDASGHLEDEQESASQRNNMSKAQLWTEIIGREGGKLRVTGCGMPADRRETNRTWGAPPGPVVPGE